VLEEEFDENKMELLDPLEDTTIRMLYNLPYKDRTLDFCAKVFGVTRERVRQIEEKTLKKIRQSYRLRAKRERLHDSMDSHYGCKYKGCEEAN